MYQPSPMQHLVIKTLVIVLITSFLTSCDSLTPVPKGRIRIKNNLSGKEYSTYTVSGGGASKTLTAGESFIFPPRTYDFSISYRARDGYRSYRVHCPSDSSLGMTVRLIDIHSNKIGGGCETVGASH